MKLILASSKDLAAKNIYERLLELYDFEKSTDLKNLYVSKQALLALVDGETTKITSLPARADELIVASRHASESGKPSLTVHVPGELEKGELALASPRTVKIALQSLKAANDDMELNYDVSLEATHHGPTKLAVPVTFVEIGSKPEQWVDKKAGEAVARALMEAAALNVKCSNAVGFGGPHYAPRHTEVTLRTVVGIGHILPKYANFNEKLAELAVLRTHGGTQLLALDWKGMSEEQRNICQKVANSLRIQAERSKSILAIEKL
ncbi:MAG: D-aminoacyl-tRNA deacylase [Methanobacteriota archaeon]